MSEAWKRATTLLSSESILQLVRRDGREEFAGSNGERGMQGVGVKTSQPDHGGKIGNGVQKQIRNGTFRTNSDDVQTVRAAKYLIDQVSVWRVWDEARG